MSRLINGEKRAEENPETFKIPSLYDRSTLQVGDFAKLIFTDDDPNIHKTEHAERMWVKVTKVVRMPGGGSPPHYFGTLDNYPLFVNAKFGDTCVFYTEHVIDLRRTQ